MISHNLNYATDTLLLITRVILRDMVQHTSHEKASSIFGAASFGRWVVTHSLADFDFHDHCPAVKMNQHPFWHLMLMVW